MATPVAQPRNQVLDILELLPKVAPLFFGSGTQTNQRTVDPRVAAETQNLAKMLETRGSSTTQADKVIEDILFRAQLAFAPVLEAEKKAGMYNTTTRNQLAQETVARATAASAQAVLEDQQRAFAQAAQLRQTQTQASGGTQQKTSGVNKLTQAAGAVTTAISLPGALKKGKQGIEKLLAELTAPGKGFGAEGDVTDIADNIYDKDSFTTFASEGGAGTPAGFGADGGSAFGGDFFTSGSVVTDDASALQSIIDSTTIPSISEGVQVADSGQILTDASAGSNVVVPDPRSIEEILSSQGLEVGAAMPAAIPPTAMPPAVVDPAVAELGTSAEGFATVGDPFAVDPSVIAELSGAAAGGSAASAGLTAAEGAGIAEGMTAAAGVEATALSTLWSAAAFLALVPLFAPTLGDFVDDEILDDVLGISDGYSPWRIFEGVQKSASRALG